MFAKKLLTLACAAGILALGACFLPPIPVRKPPPVPPRIDFRGIRRLCVSVSVKPEAQHIDASHLAVDIVESINQRVEQHIIRAHFVCRPSDDGTLQVDLLSESAALQPNSASPATSLWGITVTLNATLTDREKNVVWRAANVEFLFPHPLPAPDPETVWKTHEDKIHYLLANQLTTRFLNGE